jgi:hypothetical protein
MRTVLRELSDEALGESIGADGFVSVVSPVNEPEQLLSCPTHGGWEYRNTIIRGRSLGGSIDG